MPSAYSYDHVPISIYSEPPSRRYDDRCFAAGDDRRARGARAGPTRVPAVVRGPDRAPVEAAGARGDRLRPRRPADSRKRKRGLARDTARANAHGHDFGRAFRIRVAVQPFVAPIEF